MLDDEPRHFAFGASETPVARLLGGDGDSMRVLEVDRVLLFGDGDSTRVLLLDRLLIIGAGLLLDRCLTDGDSARVRLDDLSLVRRPASDGCWSTSLPERP